MCCAATPAELALAVLSQVVEGGSPDLSDILLVRSALMRGADVYRPLDMAARITEEVADVSAGLCSAASYASFLVHTVLATLAATVVVSQT